LTAPSWDIYFCGKFNSKPTRTRIFSADGDNVTRYDGDYPLSATGKNRIGGVFNFQDTIVTARVGILFISAGMACMRMENEVSYENSPAAAG
jgi:hypothetical protein